MNAFARELSTSVVEVVDQRLVAESPDCVSGGHLPSPRIGYWKTRLWGTITHADYESPTSYLWDSEVPGVEHAAFHLVAGGLCHLHRLLILYRVQELRRLEEHTSELQSH